MLLIQAGLYWLDCSPAKILVNQHSMKQDNMQVSLVKLVKTSSWDTSTLAFKAQLILLSGYAGFWNQERNKDETTGE